MLPVREDGVAIVTGGYGGIGYATVKALLEHGLTVIIAGRDESKGNKAVAELKSEIPSSKVEFWTLDLMSLQSVRTFTGRFKERGWPLHILINNAGCMMTPYMTTAEGFESQIGTNYLGHFLLTYELLDVLKKSGSPDCYARIINVSSIVHKVAQPSPNDFTNRQCYSPHGAYAWSKLAVVLFTYELQRRLSLEEAKVTANTLHPGVVDTNLYRNLHWFLRLTSGFLSRFFKNSEEGAYTSIYLALSDHVEGEGGRYYDNCQHVSSTALSYNTELQHELWTRTCSLLNLT